MAIIREETIHQLDSNGSIQLIIYLEKDSRVARQLKERYLLGKSLAAIQHRYISKISLVFRKIIAVSDCQVLFQTCQYLLRELLDLDEQPKVDSRVDQAIAFIAAASNRRNLRVRDIAGYVDLSESRLRHLFQRTYGPADSKFHGMA